VLKSSLALSLALLTSAPVMAQGVPQPITTVASVADITLPAGFDGVPPPTLPTTVARDADGRTTVRVVSLTAPLRLDGQLDEDLYRTVLPISDLVQVDPAWGESASEKTEIWLSFDRENIYVSVRLGESQPERMIVNEMRRDSFAVLQNENFQFAFDTFFDRRNAVSFQFNPLGGRMDGQITNESQFNLDWNPIWRVEVRRHENGWTAEAAVPFKSLRFRPGATQVWGFQARRINRWKNEVSYLTKLPANTGNNGHQRVSMYGAMVGLEVPSGSRALDLKPFVTSDLTTDLTALPAVRNDPGADVGFDVKYGVTQNLAADFTYNTDFAQVEADDQQVNLTRFNLFFPEKREFFLENQGLFAFAQNANGGNNNNNTTETPTIFYSRRIGLDDGLPVPITAGGRLTGRVGAYSLGLLNIHTGDVDRAGLPSTNFTVTRLKRDVLRRSSIGAMYTRRSNGVGSSDAAEAYGVDGTFAFYENLYVNTFWAQTQTPGVRTGNISHRAQTSYNADRYGFSVERLYVGPNFDPQVGFRRRVDFLKERASARFSPRPKNRFKAVRKFQYQASIEFFTNDAGQLETRERKAEFFMEFHTSDRLQVEVTDGYELLTQPFPIARDVTIPTGGYMVSPVHVEFQVGQQRRMSGTWFAEAGPFYDGDRVTVGYQSARVKLHPRFAIEPTLQIDRVTMPYGNFTSTLSGARSTFTVTPELFISGLVQHNSSNGSIGANLRLRWEYQPGSELFVVYNEGRSTAQPHSVAELQSRSFVVKMNRLFRF
jgi:hypothetical protein